MSIFVLSPAGSKTGGAECLHQLVHALRAAGSDAYISYTEDPGGRGSREFFAAYDAPVRSPVDDASSLVVIPELSTYLVREFPRSRKAVFWLSVDNYFYRKRISLLADLYRRLRSLQTTRLRLGAMRDCLHLSQSHYASSFLEKHGLRGKYVGDYLNDDFLASAREIRSRMAPRLDQVAYNPKKGAQHIRYLARGNPGIKFVPIENMTRDQVVRLLSESKLYIDLGPHPGKDRIPREAAALGCCIITNRMGSAGNDRDMPIPGEYKFDTSRGGLDRIPERIAATFRDFGTESRKFEAYRAAIQGEKAAFFRDTARFAEEAGETGQAPALAMTREAPGNI